MIEIGNERLSPLNAAKTYLANAIVNATVAPNEHLGDTWPDMTALEQKRFLRHMDKLSERLFRILKIKNRP